jgi:UDP:flavonoid glycosyltransferase YjiC (YdhE family)
MRILFTTTPNFGHFHPMVPIARSAVAAGHEVAFASPSDFVSTIEQAGFRAIAAGFERGGQSLGELLPEWLTIREDLRAPWTIPNYFAGVLAPAMAHDLIEHARSWMPDVLVRESCEFGGCVAAEVLGIPHAAVRSDSLSSSFANRHLAASQIAELRAEYGLPPDPDMRMLHRYLYLASESPRFRPPGEMQAPTTHLFRSGGEVAGASEVVGWMAELPVRPTVYATLGTVVSARPSGRVGFEVILRALRDEPINVILTVGQANDPSALGPQPPNVRIERYIPQDHVLPYCDVVVNHGGFSTITGALGEGLPMVLLPISGDQPYNSACCAALGVGRVVEPQDQTPGAIRSALREVLTDEQYRANARRVQAEMAALPGPECAVHLLERLAKGRQPLLAADLAGDAPGIASA